jgi:M6 family metalloprotease-like protein
MLWEFALKVTNVAPPKPPIPSASQPAAINNLPANQVHPTLDPTKPRENDTCVSATTTPAVIGYDTNGTLVFLGCGSSDRLSPVDNRGEVDQVTGLPISASIVNGQPVFSDECQPDPLVPQEWAQVQLWGILNMACARPYRYVQGTTNFGNPNSAISPAASYLPISQCQFKDPNPNTDLKFPRNPQIFTATRSTVIQVVPIEFQDYQTNTTPSEDYGKYFQFATNYLKNTSDVPITPNFRVPNHYYLLPKGAGSYNLQVENTPDISPDFFSDVSHAVGTSLQMQGVDQVLFVIAPNTPENYWKVQLYWQQNQSISFESGNIHNYYIMSSSSLIQSRNAEQIADPWLMLHEEFGHLEGLNDEYGPDGNDSSNSELSVAEQLGTGSWGNMSNFHGELLVFDKWMLGFVADSQIACISPKVSTTVWLRPSTTKGTFLKAAIIPISSSKGIVIESERSTGYNFKIPTSYNGALVYTVDITRLGGESNTQNGLGYVVIRPSSRTGSPIDSTGFADFDATLKQGESLKVDGVTIKNIEFGNFGDVVQVSSS